MILLFAPALAQDLTLEAALELAFEHNLELQQARLDLERAERLLALRRGVYDPDLSLGVDWSRDLSPSNDVDERDVVSSTSTGWSLGLSQDIPGGGSASLVWSETFSESDSDLDKSSVTTRTWTGVTLSQPLLAGAGPLATSEIRRARIQLDRQVLSWRRAREDLVVDAAGAYWQLVADEQALVLARRSVEIAEQQLQDTEERLSEGFAGSGDVLQVQRALGVARQAAVVAEADLEAARADLARLLGLDVTGPGVGVVPTDRPVVPTTSPDREVFLERAYGRNVSWLRAALSLEEAHLDRQLALNGALPDLDFVGSVGWTGEADAAGEARGQALQRAYPTWSLGVDFSVPLPARTPRAEVSRARLAEEQAELSLAAAEQDLVLRVDAAVRAVNRDASRVALADQTVAAAQAALEADQELLQEGKGSTRDVIRSLENLDEAQLERLQAQIDLQNSLLVLRRVEGSLVE